MFLLIFYVMLIVGCGHEYTNIDKYQDYIDKIPGSDVFMPNISELPEYLSIDVFYYENTSQSINLIITYSAEAYESAVTIINGMYEFLNEPLMQHDYYLIPEVEFEYQSFLIKVVSDDNFDYPEKFGMLCFSDTNYQISFLFFYDIHLHELSGRAGRMERFVTNEFRFPGE